MPDNKKNYGLIIQDNRTPQEKAKDYIYTGLNGVLNKEVMPNMDWDAYLVAREAQSGLYFDTYNCVAEAMTSALEIYFKYLLLTGGLSTADINWLTEKGYLKNGEINFSARFVGAMAGTKMYVGNTGYNVAYAIHKHGLVPEDKYAFDLRERDPKINNPEKYYQEPPQDVRDLAAEFVERFLIQYESVWVSKVADALKIAPAVVFVNAWYNQAGIYYNPNDSVNHAVVRKKFGAKQIFDTYDPFEKELTADYKYFPSFYKFTISPQFKITSMQTQKYQTYLLVEGKEQKYAFADEDGLLIAEPGKEIFAMLNSAARLGGLSNVKVIPVGLADWNSIDHFNFKKQKTWDAKTQTVINIYE